MKTILDRSVCAGAALFSDSIENAFVPDMTLEDERGYDGIPTMAQWMGRIASDQAYARKMKRRPQAFVGEYSFLSNMYLCAIIIGEGDDALVFPSAENAFQAMKCRTRKEMEQFQHIMPQEAKKLGETVELRSNWDQIKDKVMKKILDLKFSDGELAVKLLQTEDMALCENNYWGDEYWGKCWKTVDHYYVDGEEVTKTEYNRALASEEPHSLGKSTREEYRGKNRLGQLLCEVRERIRREDLYKDYLVGYLERANVDMDWLASRDTDED